MPGHNVLLLHRDSVVFEKVSQDTLEVDDYYGTVHLIEPTPEVVPVSPLVKLGCGRHHVHFQIILLHLLNLIVLCRLLFLGVSHRDSSILLDIFGQLVRGLQICYTVQCTLLVYPVLLPRLRGHPLAEWHLTHRLVYQALLLYSWRHHRV